MGCVLSCQDHLIPELVAHINGTETQQTGKRKEEVRETCFVSIPGRCARLVGDAIPEDLHSEWKVAVDNGRIVRFLLGAILLFFHKELSRSSAVHTLLGAVMGLGILMLLVAWYYFYQHHTPGIYSNSCGTLCHLDSHLALSQIWHSS